MAIPYAKLTEDATSGRAFIGTAKDPDAEMTFTKAGNSLIIINHTEVKDSLRGQGAGRKMLEVIVEMARYSNQKILPLCPFAKSQFEKDESIRDVLK